MSKRRMRCCASLLCACIAWIPRPIVDLWAPSHRGAATWSSATITDREIGIHTHACGHQFAGVADDIRRLGPWSLTTTRPPPRVRVPCRALHGVWPPPWTSVARY